MKTTPIANHALNLVGENLYRSESSGIYYALFKRDGKQIRRSLKTTDKELARRKLANLREQVHRLTGDDGKTLPFAEYDKDHPDRLIGGVAKRWLDIASTALKPASRARRECAIKQLAPHFRDVTVRNIRRQHAETWATTHAASGRSARDFNITRDTLRMILDYACQHGMLLENPAIAIKRRKEGKPAILIPTLDELRAILKQMRSATGQRDGMDSADLIEFLAMSGCRVGEARALTWGEVDFALKVFTITGGETGTKNHEARTVPMFPSLESFLLALRDKLPEPPEPTAKVFQIDSARTSLDNACKTLKQSPYSHHDMRHFFITEALQRGVDCGTLAKWVGHKDGGALILRTYQHIHSAHSRAMAQRMDFSEQKPANVVPINQAVANG
jgi:integrase